MNTIDKKTILLNELFDLIQKTIAYRKRTPDVIENLTYAQKARYEKSSQKYLKEEIIAQRERLDYEKEQYIKYIERSLYLASNEGIALVENNTARMKEITRITDKLKKEYFEKLNNIIKEVTNNTVEIKYLNSKYIEVALFDKDEQKFIFGSDFSMWCRTEKYNRIEMNVPTCGSFEMKESPKNEQYIKYIAIGKLLEYANTNDELMNIWIEYINFEDAYASEYCDLQEEIKPAK